MTTSYPSRWLVPVGDTSDDPDVFPFLAGQSFLQLKTPVWSTKVDTSVSGVERRRALWSFPVWRFKIAYELLRDAPSIAELQRLHLFFNAHCGQFQEFFYLDHTDNGVVNQQIGTGDGTTTTFQLTRSITIGSRTYTEPVRGVSGTPVVTVGGASTTGFLIGTLGQIAFTAAPATGAVIAWSGTFFFLCRFAADELDTAQLMSGLWTSQGIEFNTVKN